MHIQSSGILEFVLALVFIAYAYYVAFSLEEIIPDPSMRFGVLLNEAILLVVAFAGLIFWTVPGIFMLVLGLLFGIIIKFLDPAVKSFLRIVEKKIVNRDKKTDA
jgi:hypothetical protein